MPGREPSASRVHGERRPPIRRSALWHARTTYESSSRRSPHWLQPPGCLRVRNYTTIHIGMWHSGKFGRLSASHAWYPLLLTGSRHAAAPGGGTAYRVIWETSQEKSLGTTSPIGSPPGPCSNRHLAGQIAPRQPAQHQLSLTITRRQQSPGHRAIRFSIYGIAGRRARQFRENLH